MRVSSGVGFSLAECGGLSLAGLSLGQEKSFLPSVGVGKVSFFLLGNGTYTSSCWTLWTAASHGVWKDPLQGFPFSFLVRFPLLFLYPKLGGHGEEEVLLIPGWGHPMEARNRASLSNGGRRRSSCCQRHPKTRTQGSRTALASSFLLLHPSPSASHS